MWLFIRINLGCWVVGFDCCLFCFVLWGFLVIKFDYGFKDGKLLWFVVFKVFLYVFVICIRLVILFIIIEGVKRKVVVEIGYICV